MIQQDALFIFLLWRGSTHDEKYLSFTVLHLSCGYLNDCLFLYYENQAYHIIESVVSGHKVMAPKVGILVFTKPCNISCGGFSVFSENNFGIANFY